VRELRRATSLPAAASFKHVSPAGAATAVPLSEPLARALSLERSGSSPLAVAYARARGADRLSSFGDLAAFSETVDEETARMLRREVSDGCIAPGYDPKALRNPLLNLLNVRYVLTRAADLRRFAALPKFRHVASLPGTEVFENTDVLPRFFFVGQTRTVASTAEAHNLIEHRGIDLRETALTEQDLPTSAGPGSIQVTSYEPSRIRLSLTTPAASLLVLSETYYPGWKAWIDDQPTAIYPVDIALRGVVVPSGQHQLRMEFHPLVLPLSIGISLATAILLAGSAIVYRRRARSIQLN